MSATDDEESLVIDNPVTFDTNVQRLIELREQATVDVVETIPVPEQRASAGEEFTVVTDDVAAWPDQRLEWRFEYNEVMGRWIFECEHDHMGLLFDGRSVATLGRDYSEYPYMLAQFIAPTADGPGSISAVTAQTLGDSVSLAVMPGPAGGTFHPDAELTAEEEDALLGRYASDHPITKEWV